MTYRDDDSSEIDALSNNLLTITKSKESGLPVVFRSSTSADAVKDDSAGNN